MRRRGRGLLRRLQSRKARTRARAPSGVHPHIGLGSMPPPHGRRCFRCMAGYAFSLVIGYMAGRDGPLRRSHAFLRRAVCSDCGMAILLHRLRQGAPDVGRSWWLLGAGGWSALLDGVDTAAEILVLAEWLQEPQCMRCRGVVVADRVTEVLSEPRRYSERLRARAPHLGHLRSPFPRVTLSPGNPGASVLSGRRPRVL